MVDRRSSGAIGRHTGSIIVVDLDDRRPDDERPFCLAATSQHFVDQVRHRTTHRTGARRAPQGFRRLKRDGADAFMVVAHALAQRDDIDPQRGFVD